MTPEVFIRDLAPTWAESITFDEWIVKMISEGKTSDESFEAALRVYGRDRIAEIWRKHQEKTAGEGGRAS
ncbi:MAG: hypothetical protein A2428_02985 [Bdellovibrionales bacterium RIFOXYC1_FULL_54_43]|nr:MAG: hypothetical protein A2428_02985 [Bdellovibrionales bacterium RIFOXYC1_FULL_54_43]OFZ82646.1 MAG: hypothetical protein A2603_02420 [Bdellovibrionales bacterium RIFOXYD1_FULL_55_31]